MLRHSATSSSAIVERAKEHARSTRKAITKFARPNSFAPPPDPEAAAIRVVRNVAYFRAYYALVLWVVLLLTLAPRRRVTLFFLMAMSKVAGFYIMLLRAFPSSWVLHRILDRRLVLALVGIVVVVQLTLTDAVVHLLVALAIGIPIVFTHAVFRVRDDLGVAEDGSTAAGDESIPLTEKKGEKDLEASA